MLYPKKNTLGGDSGRLTSRVFPSDLLLVWTISGLVLNACGGGGGGSGGVRITTIQVIDGPVHFASVYPASADTNEDGALSRSERLAYDGSGRSRHETNEKGEAYGIPFGPFIAVVDGAIDTDTNESLRGQYRSLPDGRLASPVTDLLMDRIDEKSVEPVAAQIQIILNDIFGVDSNNNPLITIDDVLDSNRYRFQESPETRPPIRSEPAYRGKLDSYKTEVIKTAALSLSVIEKGDVSGIPSASSAQARITAIKPLVDGNPATTSNNTDLLSEVNARVIAGQNILLGKPIANPVRDIEIDEEQIYEIVQDIFGFRDPNGNPNSNIASSLTGILLNPMVAFPQSVNSRHSVALRLDGQTIERDVGVRPQTSGIQTADIAGFIYLPVGTLSDLSITPSANDSGTLSLDYRVFDGERWSDEATLEIVVNPLDDAPVAISLTNTRDTLATIESALNGIKIADIRISDIDGSGNNSSIELSGTAAGRFVLRDNDGLTVTNSRDSNGDGIMELWLLSRDQLSEEFLNITVRAVHDRTVSQDFTVDIVEGTLYLENANVQTYSDGTALLVESADAENDGVNIPGLTNQKGIFLGELKDNLSSSTFSLAGTHAANTHYRIVDGMLYYTGADSGDFETQDSITLRIIASGGDSSPVNYDYVLNLSNVNDTPPVISGPGTYTFAEASFNSDFDTGLDFVSDDADGGTSALTLTDDNDGRFKFVGGNLVIVGGKSFDFETPADNTFTLTLTAADSGEAGSPTYDITNPVNHVVVVTLTNTNEAPTARPAVGLSTLVGGTGHVFKATDFGFRDEDHGDANDMFASVSISPVNLQGGRLNTSRRIFTLAEINNGDLVYLPDSNQQEQSLDVTINYTVTDSGGLSSDISTLTIEAARNRPATSVTVDRTQSVLTKIDENTDLTGSPGGMMVATLQIVDQDGPPSGLVITGTHASMFELRNNQSELWLMSDTVLDHESTPFLSVSVEVSGASPTVTTGTITVNVTDLDEKPVLERDSVSGAIIHDAIAHQDSTVDGGDGDLSGTFLVTGSTEDDSQAHMFSAVYVGEATPADDDGTVGSGYTHRVESIFGTLHYNRINGNYRYIRKEGEISKLDDDFSGQGRTDTFTVTVDDGTGSNSTSDPHRLIFTVSGANDAPVSSNSTLDIKQLDGAHVFSVGDFSYTDPDDELYSITITAVDADVDGAGLEANEGTLTYNGSTIPLNTQILAADINQLVFTPENVDDDYSVLLNYTVSDGDASTTIPQTLTINAIASKFSKNLAFLSSGGGTTTIDEVIDGAQTTKTLIGNITFDDDDGAPFGTLEVYNITARIVDTRFAVENINFNTGNNSGTASLYLLAGQEIDHEDAATFDIRVRLAENNSIQTSDITITVNDVDETPIFGALPTNLSLRDDIDATNPFPGQYNPVAVALGEIEATDPEGTTVSYSIARAVAQDDEGNSITLRENVDLSQDFRIDENGNLTFEANPFHTKSVTPIEQVVLTIKATDAGMKEKISDEITVSVINIDQSDASFIITSDGNVNLPKTGDELTVRLDATAENSGNDPDGSTEIGFSPSYQWYHVGKTIHQNTDISGETANKYVVQSADEGKRIGVRITYEEDSFRPEGTNPTVSETVLTEIGTADDGLQEVQEVTEDTSEISIEVYEGHPSYQPIDSQMLDLTVNQLAEESNDNDNKFFHIENGILKWRAAPDYEAPRDFDGNSHYEIVFEQKDGTGDPVEAVVVVNDIGRDINYYDESNPSHYNLLTGEFTRIQRFFPRSIPDDDKPQNTLVRHLIEGTAFKMPKTGPVLITYSFSNEERAELLKEVYSNNQTKVDEFYTTLEATFAAFENVVNIKFIEIDHGEKEYNNGISNFTITITSSDSSHGGHTNITLAPEHIKSELQYTLTHELGHTLGLKHPFEHSGSGQFDPYTDWPGDEGYRRSTDTVMSYYAPITSSDPARITELQAADKAALRFLYGAPGTNFEGVERLIDKIATVLRVGTQFVTEIDGGADLTAGVKVANITVTDDDGGQFGTLVPAGTHKDFFEIRNGKELFLVLDEGETLDGISTLEVYVYLLEAGDTLRTRPNITITVNEASGAAMEDHLSDQISYGDIDFNYVRNLNRFIFSEESELDIEGTASDEILIGTAIDDLIDGGGGMDRMSGGAGRDRLTGDMGNDTFVLNLDGVFGDIDEILDFSSGTTSGNHKYNTTTKGGNDMIEVEVSGGLAALQARVDAGTSTDLLNALEDILDIDVSIERYRYGGYDDLDENNAGGINDTVIYDTSGTTNIALMVVQDYTMVFEDFSIVEPEFACGV